MAKYRDIHIESAAEYGAGRTGFVVEMCYGDYFAVPSWEEWGLPGLEGEFPTLDAAKEALREYGLTSIT